MGIVCGSRHPQGRINESRRATRPAPVKLKTGALDPFELDAICFARSKICSVRTRNLPPMAGTEGTLSHTPEPESPPLDSHNVKADNVPPECAAAIDRSR